MAVTTNADDVTNASTGEARGPSEPVTTHADWVPDEGQTVAVSTPKKKTASKKK